jgi:hypothetical protein
MSSRRPRPARVPSAQPTLRSQVSVEVVIRRADLRAALTVVGLKCIAPQADLRTLAFDLNMTIVSILAQRGGPPIADTRATGADLAAIANSLRAVLARFTAQAPLQEGSALAPPGPADVAAWLRRLDLPAIDALRGAAAVDHADPWLALADALLHVDRLACWAESGATAFDDGVRARQATQRLSQERRIADILIAAYPRLTGRKIGTSRPSAGGPPGGPLIRFLQEMYQRTRASIAQKPDLASLARDAALSPSAETLARWIRDHRPATPTRQTDE